MQPLSFNNGTAVGRMGDTKILEKGQSEGSNLIYFIIMFGILLYEHNFPNETQILCAQALRMPLQFGFEFGPQASHFSVR